MTGLIRQVHDTLTSIGDEALALHVRLGRDGDGIEATRTWTSQVTDGGHNALIGQAHAALAAAAYEAVQARAHLAAAAGFISEYLAVLSAGSETPGFVPSPGMPPPASACTSGSSSLERAANALAVIGAAIRRDQASLAIARNDIEQTSQQLRAPAAGGTNPLIGQVSASLTATSETVDRAIARLAAADDHVADYLAVVLGHSVIRPSGDDLAGPRTAFGRRTDLNPDAEYVVPDRGRFRTSREGLVIRVRTASGR